MFIVQWYVGFNSQLTPWNRVKKEVFLTINLPNNIKQYFFTFSLFIGTSIIFVQAKSWFLNINTYKLCKTICLDGTLSESTKLIL